jgi:hypothetical protein
MSKVAADLSHYIRDFTDSELKDYTCFAGNFRDQRLEQGCMAEAAFWNAVVNLCVDERVRRNEETRRLEIMYRTGKDPEAESSIAE